jgi:hypothetical protein
MSAPRRLVTSKRLARLWQRPLTIGPLSGIEDDYGPVRQGYLDDRSMRARGFTWQLSGAERIRAGCVLGGVAAGPRVRGA